MQFLLMCRSLTYAQRSVRALERAGVSAAVTRAPRTVSAGGCGYCVAVSAKNGPRAAGILKEAGLPPEKMYRRLADGSLEEAPL